VRSYVFEVRICLINTGLREVVWVKMPVFGTGRPLQTPPSMDPDHLVTLRKVT
jgi:hypothetical protein